MLSHSIPAANADEPLIFVSSFAAGDKGAIQRFQWDSKSSQLKPVQQTTGVENPFFSRGVEGPEISVLDPREDIRAKRTKNRRVPDRGAYRKLKLLIAIGSRHCGLLSGRRCDGQVGVRRELHQR